MLLTRIPPVRTPAQHFIGNRWVAPATGDTLPMVDPSDGKPFAAIASGNAQDIHQAVEAAGKARDGAWGRLAPAEKGRLLGKLAREILDHADELALIEARDCGKPLRQARADVAACARYFEFYGGASDKLAGDTIPYPAGYTVLTWREPHGVTGHIIPWNYPLQIFGRSVGGALAAGNACVVKPAERLPFDSSRRRARGGVGLPEGALNIVTGLGREAGAALAAHKGIEHVSFTGSPATGAWVAGEAAKRHCPVTLELGGKGPQIVSPTPISTPRCRRSSTRSSRTPARRARPAVVWWSSGHATTRCWKSSDRASRRSRWARRWTTSIAVR